jgi:hypothetical protein
LRAVEVKKGIPAHSAPMLSTAPESFLNISSESQRTTSRASQRSVGRKGHTITVFVEQGERLLELLDLGVCQLLGTAVSHDARFLLIADGVRLCGCRQSDISSGVKSLGQILLTKQALLDPHPTSLLSTVPGLAAALQIGVRG